MDLPTCPHCGESVLDDDVDECPFCGESMSAKPAVKSPKAEEKKPQQSKPTAAEKRAEPKKAPEKKAARAKESAAPNADEPFAVDQAAMSNAIALRAKPSPGRAFKVVCPMCETVGFTSPKAGGRDVKCANPKCLVPVFTCPEPPPAPVEEEPEPAGLSTTQLGLISVAAIAVIGAGIWFFVLKKDDDKFPSQPPTPNIAQNDDSKTTPAPKQNGTTPKKGTSESPKGPDLAALGKRAPELMIKASEQPAGRGVRRPKALQVQWIALALADLGDLDQAEQQLERLSGLSDGGPHYHVLPWVEIGWKRLEREQDAGDAAEKALKSSKPLPSSKQDVWLEAVSLAGFLAALDRMDESMPLLEGNLGQLEDQELWADRMAVTLDHSFNLDEYEHFRPVVTPQSPAWSAVIWQLVFHDKAATALNWAERAADNGVRSEALVACGDAIVSRSLAIGKPADYAAVDGAIQKLSEPWKSITASRAYARMGQRYARAKDEATAKKLLAQANAALEKLPENPAMAVPDLKSIYDGNFPHSGANFPMAAAAFEAARLQSALGENDEAWNSIELGLAILRSESLPLKTATAKVAQSDSSAASLRFQLKDALELETDDQARRAFRTYQKHVDELKNAAEARIELQTRLLSLAVHWGLAEQVYGEITKSNSEDSYIHKDAELPWMVYAELRRTKSENLNDLVSRMRAKKLSKPAGLKLLDDSAGWISSASNIPKLTDELGKRTLPDAVRKRWILRLAGRPVLEGNVDMSLSFLLSFYNVDPFVGEDATELTAALATKAGQGDYLWRELGKRNFSPTQRIAGYKGFVAAATPLVAPPAADPEPEVQAN